MRQTTLHWSACLAVGAAAAILGLVPWLVSGARLPLQNLWADITMPEDMPFALLPFSQYAIFFLLGLIGAGHAVAGTVVRGLRGRVTRSGAWATWSGVLAVQGIAVIQTSFSVVAGLRDGAASWWYLAALLIVVALSVALGTLAFWLIARASVAGAVIGFAIGAVCLGNWLSGFSSPLVVTPADPAVWMVHNILRWVPAVLVGAAIAWGGLQTWGRGIAALTALVILWAQMPLTTAISSATTSRVLLPYPLEMVDQGAGVLRMMLVSWELTMPPVVVAVAVAGIGLVVRLLVVRRRERLVSTPA